MDKIQTLTIPNANEDIEQQEVLHIAGGTIALEECLEVSYKAKRSFTTQPSNMLLGIYTRVENLCS